MIRSVILACGVLSLVAVTTQAQDKPPIVVTAVATRSADNNRISLSATISENKMEVVPNVGSTNVTSILSSPRILFNEGEEAQMVAGRPPAASDTGRPAKAPGEIESGVKVDVISVKGRENILMVTTVIEDGVIVWADTATVPITATGAAASK